MPKTSPAKMVGISVEICLASPLLPGGFFNRLGLLDDSSDHSEAVIYRLDVFRRKFPALEEDDFNQRSSQKEGKIVLSEKGKEKLVNFWYSMYKEEYPAIPKLLKEVFPSWYVLGVKFFRTDAIRKVQPEELIDHWSQYSPGNIPAND
jgi:hypothetical protein